MFRRVCFLLVVVWFLFPSSQALATPPPDPQTQQTTTTGNTSPMGALYTVIGFVVLDTLLSYALVATDVVMLFFPKAPPLLDGILGGVGSLLFTFNLVVLSITFANGTSPEAFFLALMGASVAGLGLSGYLLYRAFRPRPRNVSTRTTPPLPKNTNRMIHARF